MFQPNQAVSQKDLMQLNEQLRKAAQVSGQAGTAFDSGAGHLTPLVPQSIEGVLSSATYAMDAIKLYKNMPKVMATNPLHEYNVIKEHGDGFDPFIPEGGGGADSFPESFSTYERGVARIKFLAVRRFVTDLAAQVGLLGDNRTAIAEETERGTFDLLGKNEKALFHADEEVNPFAFNGVLKQVERTGTMADAAKSNGFGAPLSEFQNDLQGGEISAELLQDTLADIFSAPRYGQIDAIYMDPRVHSALIQRTVEQGRHDQLSRNNSQLTFGAQSLSVMAPYGSVPLIPAPFMSRDYAMPTAAVGSDVTKPTLVAAALLNQQAIDDDADLNDDKSQFINTDAGDYLYRVVAVTAKGQSEPSDAVGAVAIAATGAAKLTVPAAAGVLRYKIYRTEKDGTTYSFLMECKAASDGSLLAVDYNVQRTNTSSVLFASHDARIMEYVRLLDFLRRPLAATASVTPFLLMLFGSPIVKVPSKMHSLRNVSSIYTRPNNNG